MTVAVDTNVLVRYLTWDDEAQATAAASALESAEGIHVSSLILSELVWVLKRAYGYTRDEIVAALLAVMESRDVDLDRPAAEAGLAMLRRGGDFADGVVLHEAIQARCDHLLTFDAGLLERSAPGTVVLLR